MTELQERAIAKIDAEIEKEKGNRILEIIGEFLINLVTANPDAAAKLLDEKKNLKGAYEAMRNEARKYQKDGCAALTDEEGFEVVCGYYGLEYHSGGGKLENAEIRRKYYSAAGKLAESIKNITEAGV